MKTYGQRLRELYDRFPTDDADELRRREENLDRMNRMDWRLWFGVVLIDVLAAVLVVIVAAWLLVF